MTPLIFCIIILYETESSVKKDFKKPRSLRLRGSLCLIFILFSYRNIRVCFLHNDVLHRNVHAHGESCELPGCNLDFQQDKPLQPRLLIRNFSKCRLSDRIEMKETRGKILQICHSQGKIKIDKIQIVKDGILAEGIVRLKVLYIIENDEMPFYSMEAMLPFSHVVEAKGITENSVYYLHTELEQLSTTMVDSNDIEIRATIGLNVLVIQCSEEMILEKIEEIPLDQEKIRNMPGITVYIMKPGDTLWNIAKKFYTTVEEIIQMNNLDGDEVSSGTPLLLVKKVEE